MVVEVQRFPDLAALSASAAGQVIALARQAVAARGRFLLALSGGGTPQGLYELLGSEPYAGQMPWPRCFLFWGDERCVPPGAPGSNYLQVKRALLDRVPALPAAQVLRIKGELPPAEAAAAYSRQLSLFGEGQHPWPRLDLVLLGMGEDGHTASLFPGPPPPGLEQEPAVAVTAHYQGRPANRVSLTPLVFNSARRIFFLVSGAAKGATLARVLRGPFHPLELPAQRIRPSDGQVTWLVDQAAAAQLNESP